jgi:hypothetical protein
MTAESAWPKPTPYQHALLARLLTGEFAGVDALRVQAGHIYGIRQVDHDGSFEIGLAGEYPIAATTSRVPVQMHAADVDGVPVAALLHV